MISPCLTERMLMGHKESKQTNVSNGAKLLPWQNTVYFSLPVASADVPSKVVVLLLIHFLLLLPLCVWVLSLVCFVL